MARPTETMTKRCEQMLGEPVSIAVRVSKGSRPGLGTSPAMASFAFLAAAPVAVIAFVGGLLARVFRSAASSAGADSRNRILSRQPDGSMTLFRASEVFRTRPLEVERTLPPGTPLAPDAEHFEESLVALIYLGDQSYTIHGGDFKALVRGVDDGSVEALNIRKDLDIYNDHFNSRWAATEPTDFIK